MIQKTQKTIHDKICTCFISDRRLCDDGMYCQRLARPEYGVERADLTMQNKCECIFGMMSGKAGQST